MAREALGKSQLDAVFVANIPMVLGWLRAMREKGWETPRDLLLATFDHLVILDSFRPRLTAVCQPSYEIGRQGVQLLLERIAQPDSPPRTVRLSTEWRIGVTSLRANCYFLHPHDTPFSSDTRVSTSLDSLHPPPCGGCPR